MSTIQEPFPVTRHQVEAYHRGLNAWTPEADSSEALFNFEQTIAWGIEIFRKIEEADRFWAGRPCRGSIG